MPRSLISRSKTESPSIVAFTHSDGSSSSTAELNQLDPEKYLRKVLTEITNIEVFDSERFRHLLPRNIELVS
ncbi:transposase domain-containing protein [uncultured Ligilactobacillus sp.]|uniref:transposase domain-containing protein n=1 Tax=uncultured Ligilactobacillus sp. TaxID=2837633 RepID=UPI00259BC43A|nr:transposase domain-containing protein [uncultured Ligilactobacillus sp.]